MIRREREIDLATAADVRASSPFNSLPADICDTFARRGPIVPRGERCADCGRTHDTTTLDVQTSHKCGHLSLGLVAGDSDLVVTTLACWLRAQIEAGRTVPGLQLTADAAAEIPSTLYVVRLDAEEWVETIAIHETADDALAYVLELRRALHRWADSHDLFSGDAAADDAKRDGYLDALCLLLPESLHDYVADAAFDERDLDWDSLRIVERTYDRGTGILRPVLVEDAASPDGRKKKDALYYTSDLWSDPDMAKPRKAEPDG